MKRRPLFASVITSLAAILILAAGCGEQSPTATQLEPTTISASRGISTEMFLRLCSRAPRTRTKPVI